MIIIGGKEYNLQFTMPVWDRFENEICLVEEFDQVMTQKGRLKKIPKLVSLPAGQGAAHPGHRTERRGRDRRLR